MKIYIDYKENLDILREKVSASIPPSTPNENIPSLIYDLSKEWPKKLSRENRDLVNKFCCLISVSPNIQDNYNERWKKMSSSKPIHSDWLIMLLIILMAYADKEYESSDTPNPFAYKYLNACLKLSNELLGVRKLELDEGVVNWLKNRPAEFLLGNSF